MFVQLQVGVCWSSGRAFRAHARRQRHYQAAIASRKRQQLAARLESAGVRNRRAGAVRRQEGAIDRRSASSDDVSKRELVTSNRLAYPSRTVVY